MLFLALFALVLTVGAVQIACTPRLRRMYVPQ